MVLLKADGWTHKQSRRHKFIRVLDTSIYFTICKEKMVLVYEDIIQIQLHIENFGRSNIMQKFKASLKSVRSDVWMK